MAIRVKKLARELRCSPERVLDLLRALGFDKYKSAMDMVADRPAAKVRKAVANGGLEIDLPSLPAPRPVPRPVVARHVAPRSTANVAGRPDVMNQVVTGRAQASGLDMSIEALGATAPVPGSAPSGARAEEALRKAAQLERQFQDRVRQLAERETALEDQLRAFDAAAADQRHALELAQAQLAAREQAVQAVESGGVSMMDLFAERGVRGHDEASRALAQLTRHRLLDGALPTLRVMNPAAVRDVLASRLVLGTGSLEMDGVAVLTVGPDRAELPEKAAIGRLKDELASQFLLSGLTGVQLVGGGPIWHRLLRGGVDARVELRMDPNPARDAASAASDVAWADVVVLWDAREDATATAVYDASSTVVIRLSGGGLKGLLSAVKGGLAP